MARKPANVVALPTALTTPLAQTPTLFAVRQLRIADENPRFDIHPDEIAALADSIDNAGLLMPLIGYEKDGAAHITVGGRRTRALQALAARGAWDQDAASVPVILMEQAIAAEAGITEQLAHVAMSDVDTLRAFTTHYFRNLSDSECAKKMGLTLKEVKKRRLVLSLPQEILDMLWDGQLTANQAMGLTYWMDQPEILGDFFTEALNNPQFTGEKMREEFTSEISAWTQHKLTRYVSQDEYQAAGGRLQADLFLGDSYIIDPDLLESLAKQAIATQIASSHLCAGVDYLTSQWDKKTHPGLTSITTEERDELWLLKSSAATRTDPVKLARFEELSEKAKPKFPDELLKLLRIGFYWAPANHEDAFLVRDYLLPDDLEPLYEGGWLNRPVERKEPDPLTKSLQRPAPNATPAEVAAARAAEAEDLSGTLKTAIEKIVTHCHRQLLIQDPQSTFLAYTQHLADRSSFAFSTVPESSTLDFTDIGVVYHKDWLKAVGHEKAKPAELAALKPAEVRLVMAWRLLSCLTLTFGRNNPVEATVLRRFWTPDDKFMARYKTAQLIDMLGSDRVRALGQSISGVPNKAAYIRAVLAMAREIPTWVPMGFPVKPAEAIEPARPTALSAPETVTDTPDTEPLGIAAE